MFLVLAALLLLFVVGHEGRPIQSLPKVSHPQTFFGGFGPPMDPGMGRGGQSNGFVWGFGPILGFGAPPFHPTGDVTVPGGPALGGTTP